MATLAELREERVNLTEKWEKRVADVEAENDGKGRDLTEDEQNEFETDKARMAELDSRIARRDFVESQSVSKRRSNPPNPINPETRVEHDEDVETADIKRVKIPARARRFSSTQYIKGEDAERRAYRMGQFYRACAGIDSARRWCNEHGLQLEEDPERRTVHAEKSNITGGYFVPEEIDNEIIRLIEERGVFRRYARVSPMTSDTKTRNRRATGLTAYAVGEDSAITESNATWDQVTLTARKWAVITRHTNELNEDATINIGDTITGEIAYAFADKEDEAGFNGDGTSTYHGIVGVRSALKNLSATIANIAGLKVADGNAYSEITLANFNGVVAKLPQYADGPDARWYVHRSFYADVMQKLAYAAGGNATGDIMSGTAATFMGYPVTFSQVMPKTEANSQVCALLGSLRLAADFGDRRGMTVAISDSAVINSVSVFERDEIAIRGTERFDINVHDVGNANATAASQVPGPVVGLITAAS